MYIWWLEGLELNTKQKITIVIGAILLLLSGIYPSWKISAGGLQVRTIRQSLYSDAALILSEILEKSDKKISSRALSATRVEVDYHRMGVEFFIIVLLTIGAVAFFKKTKL